MRVLQAIVFFSAYETSNLLCVVIWRSSPIQWDSEPPYFVTVVDNSDPVNGSALYNSISNLGLVGKGEL